MPRDYPVLTRLYVGHESKGNVFTPNYVEGQVVLTLEVLGIAGATLIEARGVWRGKLEPCTVVEVLCPDIVEVECVRDLAQQLQARLGQEAVLLVAHHVRAEMVGV